LPGSEDYLGGLLDTYDQEDARSAEASNQECFGHEVATRRG
jgi:hypothetical protein